MKEVKRIAQVGEKIRIVRPFIAVGYSKGDVFSVKVVHPESVEDHCHVTTVEGHVILTPEYVVLEEAPTLVTRLEGVLVTMETQVQSVRQLIEEAKAEAHKERVEAVKETANHVSNTRGDIVRKAMQFVKELELIGKSIVRDLPKESPLHGCYYNVTFNVNVTKRTVVAVVRDNKGIVLARGVAKCTPSELFNAPVGKAIALQWALGLTVDPDFTDLPRH